MDVEITDDSSTGSLRDVLTNTTDTAVTTVNLKAPSPIIITDLAAIQPGTNNINALVGWTSYLGDPNDPQNPVGYLDDIVAIAKSFILTNPDPSTWDDPTYFDKNGAFEKAVNKAIDDAFDPLSGVQLSVIKGDGNERAAPVINDTRGDPDHALDYTNVAFKDFKTVTNSGVNYGNLNGGGVVGAYSYIFSDSDSATSTATVGDISYSLFSNCKIITCYI